MEENNLKQKNMKTTALQEYFGSNLPQSLAYLDKSLKGKNLLFDFGNQVVILKYDGLEYVPVDPNQFLTGNVIVVSSISLLKAIRPEVDFSDSRDDHDAGIVKKLYVNVKATHRLNFIKDDEFGFYFPNSDNFSSDLSFEALHAFYDKEVENVSGFPVITFDDVLIEERLKDLARPKYYAEVVLPFLESRPTNILLPNTTKSVFAWNLMRKRIKYWEPYFGDKFENGDFLYVAGVGQVYLLGVVKDKEGGLTLGRSSKPSLYFSRNYLNFISQYDAKMPKAPASMKSVNVAAYRTYDIPSFKGKPYVFRQIGRGQDCKNSATSCNILLITSNIEEAIEHFKTTEFAEFSDLVEEYAKRVHIPHPTEKPNGKYFD